MTTSKLETSKTNRKSNYCAINCRCCFCWFNKTTCCAHLCVKGTHVGAWFFQRCTLWRSNHAPQGKQKRWSHMFNCRNWQHYRQTKITISSMQLTCHIPFKDETIQKTHISNIFHPGCFYLNQFLLGLVTSLFNQPAPSPKKKNTSVTRGWKSSFNPPLGRWRRMTWIAGQCACPCWFIFNSSLSNLHTR